MFPVHKISEFKIFFDCMKTQLKNAWDKTRAAENEINFKNCHHLFFFYLELKNKKIYLHCLFTAKKILPINCVNVIFILLLL